MFPSTIHAGIQLAAGNTGTTGIFDLVNAKAAEAQSSALTVGGLIAVVFVIWKAWAARGAIAGVIVGAIAAAVFLFIINNVDRMQQRVGTEVNGLSVTPGVVQVVPTPTPLDSVRIPS